MCAKKSSDFAELKIKFNEESKVAHSLFLRKHMVREQIPEKPVDKTLFVASVPSFLNEKSLEHIFRPFGEIDVIYIHKKPSPKLPPPELFKSFKSSPPIIGFKVAYIVFKFEKSVEKALKNDKTIVAPENIIFSGIEKWAQEYNERIPDPELMEKEIEEFMLKYDKKVEEQKKAEKEATEPDEDGWVTVTKKGRRPGFERKETVRKKIKLEEEKRQKKKQLTNFYRFQIKESKMKNLVALRQKFEEDKKRIAAMKATRRFKPF